jgi:hypothetical protein
LHQNGRDQTAKRIDEAEAKASEDALAQRIKENIPLLGSEAALRGNIEDRQLGQPNYNSMGPELAANVRQNLSIVREELESLGALQSLTFKGVAPNGSDIYIAHFAKGDLEWRIMMTPDGIIRALGHRPAP